MITTGVVVVVELLLLELMEVLAVMAALEHQAVFLAHL